jgi:Kef-type K+ transport system membrane component KefB
MHDLDVPGFLGLLCVMLGAAKLFGVLAGAVGQPAVLGELLAGVIVGKSVLGLVDPSVQVFHLLGELGVVILLFSIGLETDLSALLRVGASASAVAVVGVVLPFALGYALGRVLGMPNLVAVVVGAALTATSVGITARVLSDLGWLNEPEGRVILGAAILDDVIGLIILTVIAGLAGGQGVTPLGVARTTAAAFGFLAAAVLLGRVLVPRALTLWERFTAPGSAATFGLLLATGLGWLAARSGSAEILGAFAAGLLIVGTPQAHDVEAGITRLGRVFVPLFFVTVGAAVDVSVLNPLDPANHRTLLIAAVLTVAAVVGKFAAGYAPFWFEGRKSLIGAGMVARGEVGLIFAELGLSGEVFDEGMFAAVTVVVLATTFLAPPMLRFLCPEPTGPVEPNESEGIEDLATVD